MGGGSEARTMDGPAHRLVKPPAVKDSSFSFSVALSLVQGRQRRGWSALPWMTNAAEDPPPQGGGGGPCEAWGKGRVVRRRRKRPPEPAPQHDAVGATSSRSPTSQGPLQRAGRAEASDAQAGVGGGANAMSDFIRNFGRAGPAQSSLTAAKVADPQGPLQLAGLTSGTTAACCFQYRRPGGHSISSITPAPLGT